MILFEAVLSLNLFFKGYAKQLVEVNFVMYVKKSVGDILFWKIKRIDLVESLKFGLIVNFELESSFVLRRREIRLMD